MIIHNYAKVSINNLQDGLRGVEEEKIAYANEHFEVIDIDFKVSTDTTLNDLL